MTINIIDSVIFAEFSPIKRIMMKLLLKVPFLTGNVLVEFVTQDNPRPEEVVSTNNLILLLKHYKLKGITRGEAIEIIETDLARYKVQIKSLPTMIFRYWDRELIII